MPQGNPQRSTVFKLGVAASAVGVAMWIVYLVLRYAMHRPMPVLLWVALGLVILGFAFRRSQGP